MIESRLSQEALAGESNKMFSFVGVYPRDEIKNDFERLMNTRDISNEMKDEANDSLRFLIETCGEQNLWFGDSSYLYRTNRYDHYINGVDFVLEYDVPGETPLRIALVVDPATSWEKTNKKISDNLRKVQKGGNQVKYFESQLDNHKGRIITVPSVIGLSEVHIDELIDHKQDNKYLPRTPAQVVFLEEIMVQLRLYNKVLLSKDGEFSKILSEIEAIQGIILYGVRNEDHNLPSSAEIEKYLINDGVYQHILSVVG